MTADGAQRGSLTPEQAVDRLEQLHTAASNALREALARYTRSGIVPTAQERLAFRYPELRVDWQPSGTVTSPAVPGRSSSRPAVTRRP